MFYSHLKLATLDKEITGQPWSWEWVHLWLTVKGGSPGKKIGVITGKQGELMLWTKPEQKKTHWVSIIGANYGTWEPSECALVLDQILGACCLPGWLSVVLLAPHRN